MDGVTAIELGEKSLAVQPHEHKKHNERAPIASPFDLIINVLDDKYRDVSVCMKVLLCEWSTSLALEGCSFCFYLIGGPYLSQFILGHFPSALNGQPHLPHCP